jgi:hypothetical protein
MLQELNITWCFNLKKLPPFIGQLNALQRFKLQSYYKLEELPASIGQLSTL